MKILGLLNSDFIDHHDSDDLSYENKRIIRSAKEYFDDCILIDPGKITLKMSKEASDVLYEVNGENVFPNLSCILIRRTRGFSEQMYDIVRALSFAYPSLPLFDNAKSFDTPVSKVSSFIKRQNKFNQPQTLIVLNPQSVVIPNNFPLPAIVKPTHGFKGRHIKICASKSEVIEHIKATAKISKDAKEYQSIGYGFLVQQYLDFTEEYRVNVINGKSIGCVIKISDKETKNADQGAVFARKHNDEVVEIAESCARQQGLFFAGVDIARYGNDYYVLECNRNPAFEHFDEALNTSAARILVEQISTLVSTNETEEPLSQIPKNDSHDSSNIAFHQPVYGNVFVNSSQVGSETNVSIEESNEVISQLLSIISSSHLGEISKAEAINDLNTVKELKEKTSNSDALQSIERKLGSVNKIIESSSGIAEKATPIISRLAALLGVGL